MIVKICGITSIEVAEAARDYGADLIGFVFAESRRRIEVEVAEKIANTVKNVGKVGVFVNTPLAEVQEIAKKCKLDFVQLHGEESPEYCRLVRYPVIKAIRVGEQFDPQSLANYDVDWVLFDSLVPGQQGGTGIPFDWHKAKAIRTQIKIPLLIAGGLTPDNVAEAIRTLSPQGIDVSGGVETDGQKDIEKIKQFLLATRNTEGGITSHA